MVVTTIYMILLSIGIAAPIGILAAVYLIEYAKPGRLLTVIHFAIENLAGIPSIIYGLFGSLFFVQILAAAVFHPGRCPDGEHHFTAHHHHHHRGSIEGHPRGYRESSLGLGATKLQTIGHVVLPNAIPGILTAGAP